MKKSILFIFSILLLFTNCKDKKEIPKNNEYILRIEQHRTDTDNWMKNNPQSPFNAKEKVEFHPLNYFPINEKFVVRSKLFEYDKKEIFPIFGTKGEERSVVRYGFFRFNIDDKEIKVNIYLNKTESGEIFYSILFTDKTTGKETYEVGRYIEFELNMNKDFIYTIDFNLAFNPYCSYSPDYSCAIPRNEDYLDVKITAGEMKFHK